MDEQKLKIIVGCLLHDIGKIVYRTGDQRNHSITGREFIKEQLGIKDKDILDMVYLHHVSELKAAKIQENSPAFISYIADNMAAASDRRVDLDNPEKGFDMKVPLSSVFNILNGNKGKLHYHAKTLDKQDGINYPTDVPLKFDTDYYNRVLLGLKDNLKGMQLNRNFAHSYLEIMEGYLSYVPSSTVKEQLCDISLYDHIKLTAAFGSCIYDYLKFEGERNYSEKLLKKSLDFYKEKVFLFYSLDISGIQDFIYTIIKKNALKSLRARSFYLEILLESIIDELLELLELTRANLFYSGGGHAYLILPNTKNVIDIIEKFDHRVNTFFKEYYGIALFIGSGWVECSSENFENKPEGAYKELFQQVSSIISRRKGNRYSADDIRGLNSKSDQSERECKVCFRRDKLLGEDICTICDNITKMGEMLINENLNHFVVMKSEDHSRPNLPLPYERFLYIYGAKELSDIIRENEDYVRSYSKNELFSGDSVSTRLWVGDYAPKSEFGILAEESTGIDRIGVLRADVDSLGRAFVRGFARDDGDHYMTISRTATLSRYLSLFFKHHINLILSEGEFYFEEFEKGSPRNVVIIYSGGDDVFLVGGWDDVIGASLDLMNAFKRFSEGTLTLSAGLGLYSKSYPLSEMARETGELENAAKNHEYLVGTEEKEKNAICLFNKDNVFTWSEFEEEVLGVKYKTLSDYLELMPDRRMSFVYRMLEYIQNVDEVINIPRLAYLLGKAEPTEKEYSEQHRAFSDKIYEWVKNPTDRKQLLVAIYIYVYRQRGEQ
ncbi:MAG: type III-A CRISPR-associated protein Cas10/Csm1 [Tissierellia bacterium]|nr:type III-A CRISPR-associated protein Cas10/Csm1 [Tissierellia bacterium]